MACCARCDDAIPAGAEILARDTYECCVVYRVGDDVFKLLKDSVRSEQILKRQAIAAAHGDLFVPFAFDAATKIIRQPFIAGPPGTTSDQYHLLAALRARGLHQINDVGPKNICGRRLIDFAVGPRWRETKRRLRARKRMPPANATAKLPSP